VGAGERTSGAYLVTGGSFSAVDSKPLIRAHTVEMLAVRDAYADWLGSLPWDFFLTITFREPVPMRRQEAVTHAVGQSIKARYETVDMLALFAEPHKSQSLHLHGLVHLVDQGLPQLHSYCRRDMQSYLRDKFGFSTAEFPRGRRAVSSYVAKYCVKTNGYYELF